MADRNESEFVFVYTTFPEVAAAEKMAAALVEAKLAACVNIFPPITSVYAWEGKLETCRETAALIKTRRALADRAIAAARAIHPYATPCFLLVPIEAGNSDYLDWARAQTAPGA